MVNITDVLSSATFKSEEGFEPEVSLFSCLVRVFQQQQAADLSWFASVVLCFNFF